MWCFRDTEVNTKDVATMLKEVASGEGEMVERSKETVSYLSNLMI